jgi:PAS domain S-box-containing protein
MLLADVPVALFTSDVDGRLEYFNPAAIALWGMAPAARGTSPREGDPFRLYSAQQELLAPEATPWAQVLRSGIPVKSLELILERLDGLRLVVLASSAPLIDALGRPIGTVTCLLDITDRKRDELALHERDQEFRAFVEGSPDQIILYDHELRRTYVNQAVANAFKTSPEALIGQLLGGGITSDGGPRRDAEIDEVRRRMRKVLETGASEEYEMTWPTPTGRKHFSNRVVPQRDPQGRIVGVFGIARDLTASREAERQLRSLAENSPDLIARFDRDGRFLYANSAMCQLGRTTPDALYGRRIGEVTAERGGVLPDAVLRVRAAVEEVGRTGTPIAQEPTIPVIDGSERTFDCRILPERDEAGDVATILLIAQDITARKHGEDARRELVGELMRAREEERGAVAHQLHNELGQSVLALLYGLERIVRVDDLEEAKRHAERLRKISAETLESLRRLAHGLHSTALEDLGLVAALEQCTEEYTESFGLPIDLVADGFVSGRLPKPMEAGLYRIALEALTNVARHSGATRASVVLSRQGAVVDLVIEDDGRGFEPEALLSTPGAPRAFGLRGIIESADLLGGAARIESTPGGTTIAVRIPSGDR